MAVKDITLDQIIKDLDIILEEKDLQNLEDIADLLEPPK